VFLVVAYDIADDRRRLKVMKLLEGYGRHVQESVFECDLEPKAYRQMSQRLLRLVSQREDNVRYYHLCSADVARAETFGVGGPIQRARGFEIV
jgi:CRISPR-associated protein Cas2